MGTVSCRRKGAILVIMVILFIVSLGFAALAVDIGFLHLQKARAQTAAEAVVLSAVRKACADLVAASDDNLPGLENHASVLAPMNAPGCNTPVFEWGIWSPATGFRPAVSTQIRSALRVTVTIDQPWLFGRIMKSDDNRLTGRSTAVWTPYGSVCPMGICSKTNLSPNASFRFGPTVANVAPGNKCWLGFNQSVNSDDLRVYMHGGPYDEDHPAPWQTPLAFNQVSSAEYLLNCHRMGAAVNIGGAPGAMTTLSEEVSNQVNAGLVVVVPIWDDAVEQGANVLYSIVGVAAVQLIGPFTGLNNIQAKVLPEGPVWFEPTQNVAESVKLKMRPGAGISVVE